MSELNKPVLVLNKSWTPIHVARVHEMVCDIVIGTKSVLDPENYILHDWEGWIDLPVLDGHRYIQATRGKKVRTPEIVVCAAYNKIPKFKVKLNMKNLWLRDGGRCQYTGEKVPLKHATKDHVLPASRGGRSTWENMVICSKEVNTTKGDRTPDEAGLKLLKKPREPKWTPLYSSICNGRLPDSCKVFLPDLKDTEAELLQSVH